MGKSPTTRAGWSYLRFGKRTFRKPGYKVGQCPLILHMFASKKVLSVGLDPTLRHKWSPLPEPIANITQRVPARVLRVWTVTDDLCVLLVVRITFIMYGWEMQYYPRTERSSERGEVCDNTFLICVLYSTLYNNRSIR
jgi:hypothetical protein